MNSGRFVGIKKIMISLVVFFAITVHFKNGEYETFRSGCGYKYTEDLVMVKDCDRRVIAVSDRENVNFIESSLPLSFMETPT